MIAPNAEQIEGAAGAIAKVSNFIRTSQVKELHSAMGAPTMDKLGAKYPPSKDFIAGYELGLQTARTVLAQSAGLAMKDIDSDSLL